MEIGDANSQNSVKVLQSDPEVICHSSLYNKYTYMIATPATIIWGLGIPVFAFYILFKNRKHLSEAKT